jgi:hypothetical protein
MLTVGVGYGIGLHYDDMRPTYLPITAMLSYGAGFCAMVSGAWSKTSFAVTLLRITEGKMRWFVWFIIVTVNVTIAVSATIMWITCWPVEKLWYPEVEGRCWEKSVGEKYQNFAAGESCILVAFHFGGGGGGGLTVLISILGRHGHCPRAAALEDRLDSQNLQARKSRRTLGHECRCLVRLWRLRNMQRFGAG